MNIAECMKWLTGLISTKARRPIIPPGSAPTRASAEVTPPDPDVETTEPRAIVTPAAKEVEVPTGSPPSTSAGERGTTLVLDEARSQSVVGEHAYQRNYEAIAARGEGPYAIAALHAEPNNPHDSNAIAVLIDGLKVGHIPRDDTAGLHPYLAVLDAAGIPATCDARLTGGTVSRGGYSLPLGLELLIPSATNAAPLSAGVKVAVTGEEGVQEELGELLGDAKWKAIQAALAVDPATESGLAVVTVYVGDFRAGTLSKKMSARYAEMVRRAAGTDDWAMASGAITTGSKKLEVVVMLPAM